MRVPFADTSVYKIPAGLTDEQVLFLSDILPTSFEVGVLNGKVSPGDTIAVVGAGPIGLAVILTARLFSPGKIIAIDLADARLKKAKGFGADVTINNTTGDPVGQVMAITDGLGVDVAIEAVGVPATFELCADLVKPGGHVANVGVHGHPATLHLEKLWIRDVTITTGLVDSYTIPRLLNLIKGGRLDPTDSKKGGARGAALIRPSRGQGRTKTTPSMAAGNSELPTLACTRLSSLFHVACASQKYGYMPGLSKV